MPMRKESGREMFQIDLKSGEPIYLQLKAQVIRMAVAGALEAGEQLPSVRVLARELGINPNTVSKAYQELETEGVLYSVAGKGSFVAENIRKSAAIRQSALEDFHRAAEKAWQMGLKRPDMDGVLDRVCGREES